MSPETELQSGRLHLGRCELDRTRGLLFAAGELLTLRARTFSLLLFLVENAGSVVSRDQIFDAVWKGVIVSDDALTQTVRDLRQVLGDSQQTLVRTIAKRGYVLVLPTPVENVPATGGKIANADALRTTDQPTLAVLPFDNISSEPDQSYFVDGLVDDLITDLSKVDGLTVIARNSSFVFQGRRTNIREVGRELGARYIVEGSVRRIGLRVRITAHLADTATGSQLWADRFDSDLIDVFELQDDIARRLVAALSNMLPIGAPVVRRRAKTLAAFELCAYGRAILTRSGDDNKTAREALQRAVELEPDYSDAHAWLSFAHHYAWLYAGQPELPHRGLSLEAAEHAIALDPANPDGYWSFGLACSFENRLDDGIAAFGKALALNPNLADAWATYADPLVYSGRNREAVESVRRALRLNPFPPERYRWFLGFAEYAAGEYAEAAATLRHPSLRKTEALRILAAALAMLEQTEEATRAASAFLSINPNFRIAEFMARQPFARQAERQRFQDGYKRAGLPG